MARAALSLPFSGLSGSLGETTIVQRPDGPLVRERRYRPRALTPAQAQGADRMRRVSQAWGALDDATFAAWNAYAETQAWRNPATGAIVTPKAFNLFCGLASRARMVDPLLDLSGFTPPERAFGGDGVVVEISPSGSPSFHSGERKGAGDGERESFGKPCGSLPLPPLSQAKEGVLTFFADRANAFGVVTEVLTQPLVNARRRVYRDKYVSAGFHAFPAAGTFGVPLKPGAYAVAYRFVRAATGQDSPLVELGVIILG